MPRTTTLRPLLGERKPSATDTDRLAAAFAALAHPSRLRMLRLIATWEETCAVDLVGPLGLTQPTVSHHLNILIEAGLVDGERLGSKIRLTVVRDRLTEIAGALAP